MLDLLGHKLTDERICFQVHERLFVVGDPEPEARLRVHVLPERFSLLGGRIPDGILNSLVHEAESGAVDFPEYLRVVLSNLLHLIFADLGVVQGNCLPWLETAAVVRKARTHPVWCPLEDRQALCGLGHLWNDLNRGRAHANDPNILALETDDLLGPTRGVKRLTLEVPHAGHIW